MQNSSLGINREIAAALSYTLGPITGLIFLILEKDSFVKYHAIQAIFGLGLLAAIAIVFGFIPFLGQIVMIIYFVALLTGAYQASQGKHWEMPLVGQLAKKAIS